MEKPQGVEAKRVAVIEDDPDIASMLRETLALDGFQVTIIPEGSKAVQALASGGYSAAVLDVMLPGKDGITIMQEIRAAPETQALPVVMLTARTDDQTTWAGWTAGADYFMTKPFDPEELIRTLKKITSTSSMKL